MNGLLRVWLVAGVLVALPASMISARAVAHTSALRGSQAYAYNRHAHLLRTREHRTRTTWDSVFTAAQVARGQSTYGRDCARCHQAALGGADQSPALTGGAFMSNWNGQTLGDLHDRVRVTMPSDTPGTYSRKDVADVIAYVLSFNGFPAGSVELPIDDGALKAIVFSSTKP